MKRTQWSDILEREMVRRSTANTGYSLRAFARDLEMAPSAVSYILRGERQPSKATAQKLIVKLGLNIEQMSQPGGAYRKGEVLLKGQTGLLDDWWKVAVFEALGTEGTHSVESVARLLGLKESVVSSTLEELQAEGLVESDGNDFRKNSTKVGGYSSATNYSLREYHKQLLKRAGASIDKLEPHQRVVGSITLPTDPEAVSRVQKLWNEFVLNVEAELSSQKRRTGVSTAVFSFFPAHQCRVREEAETKNPSNKNQGENDEN